MLCNLIWGISSKVSWATKSHIYIDKEVTDGMREMTVGVDWVRV